MKAILRRHISEFGLDLVWYGNSEICVENNGDQLYKVSFMGNGIKTATRIMENEENIMMRVCESA